MAAGYTDREWCGTPTPRVDRVKGEGGVGGGVPKPAVTPHPLHLTSDRIFLGRFFEYSLGAGRPKLTRSERFLGYRVPAGPGPGS